MRIQKQVDSAQFGEQAGFRSGYGAIDHIQIEREVISRTNEYEIPLHICFIDYEKVSDSVRTDAIVEVVENQGVHKNCKNDKGNIRKCNLINPNA